MPLIRDPIAAGVQPECSLMLARATLTTAVNAVTFQAHAPHTCDDRQQLCNCARSASMPLHGRNIIGGELSQAGQSTFLAVNAASGAHMQPPFVNATGADVHAAFAAANDAFATYSQSTGAQRAAFLRKISDEIIALGDELIARAHEETALPVARLTSERGRTTGQLNMFADLVDDGSWVDACIDTGNAMRTPIPKPDLRRMLIAIGPVAVFGASNFPFAFSVSGGDTASALAAGCPVVCKAHPAHPGTSELAARAINNAARACGIHPGVFSLLHGWSHEVGLAMTTHPLACAVGFTGSLRGGRAIFDAAAQRVNPIPVYAEMGSVNPVFLLPSAAASRAQAIADGLAQSITQGVGQFCTNPGVIVAMQHDATNTVREMVAQKISVTAASAMLYPQLRGAFDNAVQNAVASGARIVAQASHASDHASATLLEVDAQQFINTAALRHEMFGPVSVLVVAKNADELQLVAQSLEGQLTATVHGTDEELANHRPLIQALEQRVGRIVFNGYPTGVEVTHAMHHGGPYPASTDSRSTSVGSAAITRFARPVCYQNFPDNALPPSLRSANPLDIWRRVNGQLTQDVAPAGA